MERHVHLLVEHVDRGRAPPACRAELSPKVEHRVVPVSAYTSGQSRGCGGGGAYVVRKGALGAWTFLKGPTALRETAYEMSYLRLL